MKSVQQEVSLRPRVEVRDRIKLLDRNFVREDVYSKLQDVLIDRYSVQVLNRLVIKHDSWGHIISYSSRAGLFW